MNAYAQRVYDAVKNKDAHEAEFLQAVGEVLSTLSPMLEQHPEYEKLGLLERIVEPERIIQFRVPWVDDQGQVRVNRGYRVQFNGAIGPYKGGLRFHPSVNLSLMKFLAFEQTFKNSLTTLPMGGGKGGSDFDPRDKSDAEVMRFCQSFMTELYRHIGPDVDVPAGDIGVGGREVGYLYGQYRRIRGAFENGVLTGKPLQFGGSLIRPEATGFGAVYYLCEVLKHQGDDIKGKTIAISGYGNVAWGVTIKAAQLGAKVVTLAGSNGYIYDPEGIVTKEKQDFMLKMRAGGRGQLVEYAKKFGVEFFPGERPWGVKADVCIPCATQNEFDLDNAKQIVANGTKYYLEGANMPATPEALEYMQHNGVIVGPGKASNAGGVSVSGLEMSQNSGRLSWSAQEVDAKLQSIMKNIHDASAAAAEEYGLGYDLVAGANLAGFKKVAEAMIAQGVI
ncbi:MAG TPA: NADP-specific glutamate dehydrogenase [Candidatus Aphodomonas merdavium]|nr:NADP-specific glutamate dehydrogenase [Candidatus Aphodomonas merdavium]